jgi:3-hydroxyisobutyrate dehydrogenase-like beta-hydroxyacid dehydrogenase
MTSTAFIGLGVMGAPMAGHLVAAGHDVVVFNRTGAKADVWVERHGGRAAPTPRAAAESAEVVFTCVGNDDDVRAVVLGDDGAFAGMASGTILVDHTTASATLATELHGTGAEQGIGVLDAPISGGQAGAENGVLTVMCGGDPAHFDRAAPVIDAYARACTLVGPAGSGQRCKMVNQIAIAGILQGLSEAIALGLRAGLDMDVVLDVVSKGAAGSWQMENRGRTLARDEFDFGFAVEWMRKDLGICFDEADRLGASLPVARLVDSYYAELMEAGGARWDTSSLIRRLRDDIGDLPADIG